MRARALEDTDRHRRPPARPRRPSTTWSWSSGRRRRRSRDALSVAAVRGPGFTPGLLRSTTTQRDGFVNLTDVAPTVLTYFGLDRPDAMEGRRMETGDAGGSLAERRDVPRERQRGRPLPRRPGRPVDERGDGASRSSSPAPPSCSTAGCGCAARWAVGLLVFAALWLLGFLDATYLAGPFHFGRNGGAFAYWAFVVVVGAVIAAVCMLATRRRPVLAVLAGLGTVVALAPRRPRDRRAPRVEHRVRLLGDHRHPLRRPGQHDVLAAHRGRGAVRRPARLAGADESRRAHRGRRCSRSR